MAAKIITALCLFLLCGLYLSPGKQASAQQTQISVSPAIVDAPVEVGGSVKKRIQVTNGSDSALPISVEAQAVTIEGESIAGGSQKRFDVSDWISFSEKIYVFAPGETKLVEFTITAPFTALPGGHYAQISLRGLTLESTTDDQSSSLIFPEVGVPVLITVPGEITEDASIAETNIFPLFASINEQIKGNVAVQNNGTVHNIVRAKLIFMKDGEVISNQPLQPTVILPGTQRSYEYEWMLPEYGRYEAFVELSYGSNNTIVSTYPETVYSTPSFGSLGLLAVFIWTILYLYPRRENLVSALRVLINR